MAELFTEKRKHDQEEEEDEKEETGADESARPQPTALVWASSMRGRSTRMSVSTHW